MNSTKTATLLGLAALAFSFSSFAQNKDPKVAECRASNVKLDKELDAMLDKGKKEGKISTAESAEFSKIENRIKQRRERLTRDGFTLADCQEMTKEFVSAKAELEKMLAAGAVAPPPAPKPVTPPAQVVRNPNATNPNASPEVAACRAGNSKLDKELDALFAKAKAESRISQAEARRYEQMEGQIAAHRNRLARDGFTLADCQSMTKDYQAAKVEVEKMIASAETKPVLPKPATPAGPPPSGIVRNPNATNPNASPEVAACRAGNMKLDNEIEAIFAKAKASGKITPAESARFKQLEANVNGRRARLSRDGFTLADCQTMTREYEAEKAEVLKMAQ